MLEAVFFDLDGTLVDTAPDLAGALNALRVRRAMPPLPFDFLRPVTSQGSRGLLRLGFGITPEHADYAAMQDEFLQQYADAICVHSHLFPGMDAVLSHLETRQIPWGIVTNKHRRYTEPLLSALGLSQRAVCVVCGDSAAHPKPAPDPLLLACELSHTEAAHCLYVGDDERDIQASRAAAMPVIAAGYGYLGEAADPATWQADHVVAQAIDIIPLLNQYKILRTPSNDQP